MVKKKIFRSLDKDTKIDSIGKVIQYLYYRFSEYSKWIEKNNTSPDVNGFFMLVGHIFLNVLTIFIFILYFFKIDFNQIEILWSKYSSIPIKYIIVIPSMVIVAIVCYYGLRKRINYETIYDKFSKETIQQRKNRSWLVFGVYVAILTFGLLFLSMYLYIYC